MDATVKGKLMRFSPYKNKCLKVFWQQLYKLKLDTQVIAVSQDVADGQNMKGIPFSILYIYIYDPAKTVLAVSPAVSGFKQVSPATAEGVVFK